MNYWPHFLNFLLIMLIYFHFGFSMERPNISRSSLNPYADEFRPIVRPASPNPPISSNPNPPIPTPSIPTPSIPTPSIPATSFVPLPSIPAHLIPAHSNSPPSEEIDENEVQLPDYMMDMFGVKKPKEMKEKEGQIGGFGEEIKKIESASSLAEYGIVGPNSMLKRELEEERRGKEGIIERDIGEKEGRKMEAEMEKGIQEEMDSPKKHEKGKDIMEKDILPEAKVDPPSSIKLEKEREVDIQNIQIQTAEHGKTSSKGVNNPIKEKKGKKGRSISPKSIGTKEGPEKDTIGSPKSKRELGVDLKEHRNVDLGGPNLQRGKAVLMESEGEIDPAGVKIGTEAIKIGEHEKVEAHSKLESEKSTKSELEIIEPHAEVKVYSRRKKLENEPEVVHAGHQKVEPHKIDQNVEETLGGQKEHGHRGHAKKESLEKVEMGGQKIIGGNEGREKGGRGEKSLKIGEGEKSLKIGEGEKSLKIGEGEKSLKIGEGEKSLKIGEGEKSPTAKHSSDLEQKVEGEIKHKEVQKIGKIPAESGDASKPPSASSPKQKHKKQEEKSPEQKEEKDKEAENVEPAKTGRQRKRERQKLKLAVQQGVQKEILGGEGAVEQVGEIESTYVEKVVKGRPKSPSAETNSPTSSSSKGRMGPPKPQQKSAHREGGESGSSNLPPPPPSHSAHQQPSPRGKEKAKSSAHSVAAIRSRVMNVTPQGSSQAVSVTAKGGEGAEVVTIYDILAYAKPSEDNRYDPLDTKKKGEKDEAGDEEEEGNEEKNSKESEGKELAEGSSSSGHGGRHSAKAKGKSIMRKKDIKRMQLEKEKEEEAFLREYTEIAEAGRRLNERQEALEKAKAEAERKEKLKSMLDENMKKVEENLAEKFRGTGLLSMQTEAIVSTERAVEGLGNISGSESIGVGGSGGPVTTGSRISLLSSPAIFQPPQPTAIELLRKSEITEYYLRIKDLLKNMNKKLKELENFEKELTNLEDIRLIEKLKNFLNAGEDIRGNLIEANKSGAIRGMMGEFEINRAKIKANREGIDGMTRELVELRENKQKLKQSKLEKKVNVLVSKLKQMVKNDDSDKLEEENEVIRKELKEDLEAFMDYYVDNEEEEEEEGEEMKEIKAKFVAPLKYLWFSYNLVLTTLNEHWTKYDISKAFLLRRPYHFISAIYGVSMKVSQEEKVVFNNTMQRTLDKLLTHRIDGKLVDKQLECFKELSEKMYFFDQYKAQKVPRNYAEHLENYGNFFKEELNERLLCVFRFNMVGLGEMSEVKGTQMILEGVGRMAKWLPGEWQKRFNEIYVELYEYFGGVEKRILKVLSEQGNDKLAEEPFDLDPDYYEERLKEMAAENRKLKMRVKYAKSTQFSMEIKMFMLEAFEHIEDWIRSVNLLLKIDERRKLGALPFLEFFYDKYWYLVARDRYKVGFALTRQYYFGKEENRTEKNKKVLENLARVHKDLDKTEIVELVFKEIEKIEPSIVDGMMAVIEVVDKVAGENEIAVRGNKFESDKDFMGYFLKENPNLFEYKNRRKMMLGGREYQSGGETDEEEREERRD